MNVIARILLCLSLISLPLCLWADYRIGEVTEPPVMKILLHSKIEGALLEVRGPFQVVDPYKGKKLSSGRWGKRFYLRAHQEGIQWGEDFPGIFQIEICPKSTKTRFLVNGIEHRGSLAVYHIDGKLHLVNKLDIETFIQANLPNQPVDQLSPPVLRGVAIVARTHAYYTCLANQKAFYHLKADTIHYQGTGLCGKNPAVEQAVELTSHLIMTYRNHPFPSTWTSICAGKTASYRSIVRQDFLTPSGVNSEVGQAKRTENAWQTTIATDELARLAKLNRITGVRLFVDQPSGKVYALRLQDGLHSVDLSFDQLQTDLGNARCPSNDFTVTLSNNHLCLSGYGEGAGMGLCLRCADQLTDQGMEVPELMQYFFPDIELKKISKLQHTMPE